MPVMGCFPTQRSTSVAVIWCWDLARLLGWPWCVWSRVPAKTSHPASSLNPVTLPTAPLPAAVQPGHPHRPKTFTFTTPGILPAISAGPGRASCLGAQLLVPCTDHLGQDGSIYASGSRHKRTTPLWLPRPPVPPCAPTAAQITHRPQLRSQTGGSTPVSSSK